jgi:hypothetical protein
MKFPPAMNIQSAQKTGANFFITNETKGVSHGH